VEKHQKSRGAIINCNNSCPLCGNNTHVAYHHDAQRTYRRCSACLVIFVPAQFWLSQNAEKAEYELHQNDIHDKRYRKFLSRLYQPLLDVLQDTQVQGLDYGCGPAPALAEMLSESGLQMEVYDPIYFATSSVLNKRYDFICATEVVEHFRDPDAEFERLFSLLKPHGVLAIMTKLVRDQASFRNWHYIRDKTHICFYSRETFSYIGGLYDADLTYYGDDVIFLQIT